VTTTFSSFSRKIVSCFATRGVGFGRRPFCAIIAPHEMGLCRSHWLDNGLGSLRRNMGNLGEPGSKPGRWQSSASARRVGHEHCLHRHCAVLGRVLSGRLAAARSGRVHARLAYGMLASVGARYSEVMSSMCALCHSLNASMSGVQCSASILVAPRTIAAAAENSRSAAGTNRTWLKKFVVKCRERRMNGCEQGARFGGRPFSFPAWKVFHLTVPRCADFHGLLVGNVEPGVRARSALSSRRIASHST